MKQQRPEQRIGYFPEQQPLSDDRPEASESPKHPPVSRQRLLALILCAVVFLTCLFLLGRYAYNILITRRASSQLEEAYRAAQQQSTELPATPTPTAAATQSVKKAVRPSAARPTATPTAKPATVSELWPTAYADNPTRRVSPVFYQLQEQNSDIVGWLKIDGLLEEAVVQRDNTYYLTHNALRQRSVTGALFLDENCNLDTVPTQMLIHGHNMKEGAMFGSLKKYKVKDASYYRAHPFIDFNTIYENGRYVIFAVAEVDIRSGYPDYLPFWQHVRFRRVDDFTEYVQRAQLLSHYRCNVDVQPGDRLLTLSTCTGTDDNKRLVIMARKLRKNENEFELNMRIMSTSDR